MKRTVSIATAGVSISVLHAQLVVRDDAQVLGEIPIEDIGIVTLEGPGIRMTSGALFALSEAGAVVLACDNRHLPSSITLPVAGHSLHAERIRQQAAASVPLRKNLWQHVVRAKIRNQAGLIRDTAAHKRMMTLASGVRSGDPANAEAQAARVYWPALFKPVVTEACQGFRRDANGDFPNSLLNYGYAILRAATARALCGAGLHPGLGIHHQNRYSGFPLADDLMEPFRPWVDQIVLDACERGVTDVTKESRADALEVLGATVKTAIGIRPLWTCLDHAAATLAKAFAESLDEGTTAKRASSLIELPSWPEEKACA